MSQGYSVNDMTLGDSDVILTPPTAISPAPTDLPTLLVGIQEILQQRSPTPGEIPR